MTINFGDGTSIASGGSLGKVLQVVSEHSTGKFTTSSSSYTDVQSKAITPSSSSSKVLVQVYHSYDFTDNNRFCFLRLNRNGSDIAIGDTEGPAQRCTVDISRGHSHNDSVVAFCMMFQFLDSPNSTSSVTYKTRVKLTAGGTAIFGRTGNVNDGNRSSTIFQMTLTEIAA
tara:strand:+ start:484 stop:996 length:513 start_codon:yes stop_codon:yes gene_type:complete